MFDQMKGENGNGERKKERERRKEEWLCDDEGLRVSVVYWGAGKEGCHSSECLRMGVGLRGGWMRRMRVNGGDVLRGRAVAERE